MDNRALALVALIGLGGSAVITQAPWPTTEQAVSSSSSGKLVGVTARGQAFWLDPDTGARKPFAHQLELDAIEGDAWALWGVSKRQLIELDPLEDRARVVSRQFSEIEHLAVRRGQPWFLSEGRLCTIDAKGNLDRIRHDPTPEWTNVRAMTAHGWSLYVLSDGMEGGHLAAIDPTTGAYEVVESEQDFSEADHLVSSGDALYTLVGGRLVEIDPDTGDALPYKVSATPEWKGVTLMTSWNGWLWLAKGDFVYKVDPADGSWTTGHRDHWSTVKDVAGYTRGPSMF